MNMKKRLGKGFDALIGSATSLKTSEDELVELDVNILKKGKFQPRTYFDDEALEELSKSIKTDGIIEPLIVRHSSDGAYEIICGERRFEAAKKIGLKKVPAIVKDVPDLKALEISMIENLQRENLNPIEEAEGYHIMANKFHLSQQDISQRVGKSRSTVANSMRLLDLPEEVKLLVRKSGISAGHARTILSLKEKKLMIVAAQRIVDKNLSVRDTENYVEEIKRTHKPIKKQKKIHSNPEISSIESKMSEKIGNPVKIKMSGKKGRIVIEFFSHEELNQIMEKFGVTELS
ncbi:ParB/RepB/Spo0J family partition protein [candidate division WOR-3 bacterium]|nr:ParB/RepB/Spo0J family partition protein [candidate division WOR-3 bacterium]